MTMPEDHPARIRFNEATDTFIAAKRELDAAESALLEADTAADDEHWLPVAPDIWKEEGTA